jgi:FAD/FMN-containing dehydrogenase
MACDNLISADVVTADGELLIASEAENADLFWGVRGGGGNFGIVTAFEYQLHPVDHVLGGAVFYPLSTAREVFPTLYEFATTAPDEISTMVAPTAAFGGMPATGIAVCYCGDSNSRGEQLLARVRKLGTPLADLIQERSYITMQSMFDDLFTPNRLYYWKSSLIRTVDRSFIDVALERAAEMPLTPGTFIYMQQLHGAATRIHTSATAFPHRYDHFNCGAMAGWDSPADTEKNVRWSRRCWEAFKPLYDRSAYVNDLGEEGEQRVREAFGENYQRLVALKRRYDPNNFFQNNQNVSPEAGQASGAA